MPAESQSVELCGGLTAVTPCPVVFASIKKENKYIHRLSMEIEDTGAVLAFTRRRYFSSVAQTLSEDKLLAAALLTRGGRGVKSLIFDKFRADEVRRLDLHVRVGLEAGSDFRRLAV